MGGEPGVGDCITVCTLAWKVYKGVKDAPDSFQNIHNDVLSLNAVLTETEEVVRMSTLLSEEAEARLEIVLAGCNSVLKKLDKLVDKYKHETTMARTVWKRLKWFNEGIAEYRQSLIAAVVMLNAFIGTSQVRVQQKLVEYRECQRGDREGSIISVQTAQSLAEGDQAAWRAIRKELEGIGITAQAFKANHDFIFAWFVRAYETGAFEQRPLCDGEGQATPTTEASLSPREQSPTPDNPGSDYPDIPLVTSTTTEETPVPESLTNTCTDVVKADGTCEKPGSRENIDSQRVPTTLTTVAYLPRTRHEMFSKSRYQHHEIYELLKKKPRPSIDIGLRKQALLDACMYSSHSDMVETFLNHGASPDDVDNWEDRLGYMFGPVDEFGPGDDTLHGLSPLMLAASRGRNDIVGVLIDWGADVNYHMNDHDNDTKNRIGWMSTALGCAVTGGDLPTVRTILAAKASVNEQEKWKGTWWSALHEACRASSVEVCQELLNWGAQPDLCSKLGTPLMVALYFRKYDIVRLLLERGANPSCGMVKANIHGHKKPLDVAIWVANDSERHFLDDDISAITMLSTHGARMNSEERKSERNIRERRDGWKNDNFDHWPLRAHNVRTGRDYAPQSDPSRGIVGCPTVAQMGSFANLALSLQEANN